MNTPSAPRSQTAARRLTFATIATLGAWAALHGTDGWAGPGDTAHFPLRTITLVVAGPAGGATDGIARVLAARMSKTLGKEILVDNKAGAGGVIGTKFVANAKPDGYTLLLGHSATNAIAPAVHKPRPYDPVADFEAIGAVGTSPNLLVVASKDGAESVKSLLIPVNGAPISYGSTGIGGNSHLMGHVFSHASGISMLHVPYRGSPPALQDLVGGRVSMMFATAGAVVPYLQSGQLKTLAVASGNRSRFFPDTPTMQELKFPQVVQEGWFGLFATGGTPRDVVQQLNQSLNLALAETPVRKNLENLYVEVSAPTSPQGFKAFVRKEAHHWNQVVSELGVRAE